MRRASCVKLLCVAGTDCFHAAQLTFPLGAFLGENMTHERMRALEFAATQCAKPLGGAALGFHLRHTTSFSSYATAGDSLSECFTNPATLIVGAVGVAPVSQSLNQIFKSFSSAPASSPAGGLPSWGTARLPHVPPNRFKSAATAPCRFPDAPSHDRESAA